MEDRPPLPADSVELAIAGSATSPEDADALRQAAEAMRARARGGAVRSVHVDIVLREAFDRGAKRSELDRIRLIGDVLLGRAPALGSNEPSPAGASTVGLEAATPNPDAVAPVAHSPAPSHTPLDTTAATSGHSARPRRKGPLIALTLVAVLAVALILAFGLGSRDGSEDRAATSRQPVAHGPDILVANRDAPGEDLDLDDYAVEDKPTIFVFTSQRCPACRDMDRVLHTLADLERRLAVRQLDIDRPGSRGVDFDSPLADSYDVSATPYFIVVDARGQEIARGEPAHALVRDWYTEAVQGQHLDDLGEIADRYRER